MNRQSLTTVNKQKKSTLPPSTDTLQRKKLNRTEFDTSTFDTWSPYGQQVDKHGLPGVDSHLSYDFSKIPITSNIPHQVQAKLKIGQPDDKYEQEADRVADQVMRMSEPAQIPSVGDSSLVNRINSGRATMQRACAACSEEEELIQEKTSGGITPEVTPGIGSEIQSLQGGGQPLTRAERSFFEPRFRTDFSNVRVHNDTRAASAARSVNARAFTLGHNVVFGAGEYSSALVTGRKLLAHELTHVVQQRQHFTDKSIQRWSVSGNTATSDKTSDTLGGLSKSQGGHFNDWKCIKPVNMKTFDSGKATEYQKSNYELYVQIGDQFDIANLTATTGETLKYYLFDDTSEKIDADVVKRFYPGSSMGVGGDSDIDTKSNSGSKPIKNMLIFAHSAGGEMWGGVGNFIPAEYHSENPKQGYAVANAGLFPRRCWFTRNATVRSVGCSSQKWGNDFAKVFLRKGASINSTTKAVQPHCRGKGYDSKARTCVFYNGLAFASGSLASSSVLDGPFWNTADFHGGKYWSEIKGKL